jgi:hypothetical protein
VQHQWSASSDQFVTQAALCPGTSPPIERTVRTDQLTVGYLLPLIDQGHVHLTMLAGPSADVPLRDPRPDTFWAEQDRLSHRPGEFLRAK